MALLLVYLELAYGIMMASADMQELCNPICLHGFCPRLELRHLHCHTSSSAQTPWVPFKALSD